MMQHGFFRFLLPGLLLATAGLGGCEDIGKSGVEAELARIRGEKGFAVISSTATRAVFAVRGQRIVVEPPDGYCLDEGSVDVSRLAAFALVADCLQDRLVEMDSGSGTEKSGQVSLPRSFPGILTISISGEPAYDRGPQALDNLEALIESEQGRKLLGRGKDGTPGHTIATRRIGGALYVLIEAPAATGATFLAPRFWRAFIDVSDRMVLVTVSSFSDRPIAEDAMMGFLAQQMSRLRDVNGLIVDDEEVEIARNTAQTLDLASGVDTLVVGRAEESGELSDGIDPKRAPAPPPRNRTSIRGASNVTLAGAGPPNAPMAPRRPG